MALRRMKEASPQKVPLLCWRLKMPRSMQQPLQWVRDQRACPPEYLSAGGMAWYGALPV